MAETYRLQSTDTVLGKRSAPPVDCLVIIELLDFHKWRGTQKYTNAEMIMHLLLKFFEGKADSYCVARAGG